MVSSLKPRRRPVDAPLPNFVNATIPQRCGNLQAKSNNFRLRVYGEGTDLASRGGSCRIKKSQGISAEILSAPSVAPVFRPESVRNCDKLNAKGCPSKPRAPFSKGCGVLGANVRGVFSLKERERTFGSAWRCPDGLAWLERCGAVWSARLIWAWRFLVDRWAGVAPSPPTSADAQLGSFATRAVGTLRDTAFTTNVRATASRTQLLYLIDTKSRACDLPDRRVGNSKGRQT